ncbi:MAG: HEAT repeat domain-containing protein [Myxococcales bacterium]|nr:HEAT repeat domain-containing protein [Myxococcales bacterium]
MTTLSANLRIAGLSLALLVLPNVATAGDGADLLTCARLDQSVCPALKLALANPVDAAAELRDVLQGPTSTAADRIKAGVALGILMGKRAGPTLLKAALAQPAGSEARVELLAAAARGGAKEAVPELMTLLKSGKPPHQVMAIGGLTMLGHKPAAAHLLPLLKDTAHPRLQAAAAFGLTTLGDKSAVPALVSLASTPKLFVRTQVAALNALAKLDPKAGLTTAARLVQHPAHQVGRAALRVIAAAPARWTQPMVIYALKTPGLRGYGADSAAAMKALKQQVLIAALALDLSVDERARLMRALITLKPLGAAVALMGIFGKVDNTARIEILKTLPKLNDKTVVPALVRELERGRKPVANYAVYALENLTGERLGDNVAAWRKFAGLDDKPGDGSASKPTAAP